MTEIPPSRHVLRPMAFASLYERLGIEPGTPIELEPVEGPPVEGFTSHHAVVACSGTFRVTDASAPIWELMCDECRAVLTAPARIFDPEIEREGRLAKAEIPDRFRGVRFQRDPDNGPVLDAFREWLAGFDGEKGAASLLPAPLLHGDAGRGKSHLLAAVCERVIGETPLTAMFCSVRTLLRHLQRFDNDVIRGSAWEKAVSVDVLALDDLGSEQTTDWRLDQLGHLIDERYSAERPVVVATNYPPSRWELVMDHRTISRLHGMTIPLELKGRDRRQQTMEAP